MLNKPDGVSHPNWSRPLQRRPPRRALERISLSSLFFEVGLVCFETFFQSISQMRLVSFDRIIGCFHDLSLDCLVSRKLLVLEEPCSNGRPIV